MHQLDVVAVGVDDKRGVVPRVVDDALAGLAVVAVAGSGGGAVERVDGCVVRRWERQMHLFRRLPGDDGERTREARDLRAVVGDAADAEPRDRRNRRVEAP